MRALSLDTIESGRRSGVPAPRHGRKRQGWKSHGRRDMSEQRIIHARGLSRRYGERRVLQGLDLEVERGGFVLVTGSNGSGKTTLLRLCAGLIAPTGGKLDVAVERAGIGFLGHEPLVYRELTALENLDLYGRLYRVPERRERAGMLLERFGLWRVRNERAGSFSRGMLQRLALCRALLHEPELYLFDEPYSALDEEGASLLDSELAELRSHGTFLVATHDPGRLEPLASGRLAFA
jgi:ABC-type multidrug transport system ATPase subunit